MSFCLQKLLMKPSNTPCKLLILFIPHFYDDKLIIIVMRRWYWAGAGIFMVNTSCGLWGTRRCRLGWYWYDYGITVPLIIREQFFSFVSILTRLTPCLLFALNTCILLVLLMEQVMFGMNYLCFWIIPLLNHLILINLHFWDSLKMLFIFIIGCFLFRSLSTLSIKYKLNWHLNFWIPMGCQWFEVYIVILIFNPFTS